MRRVRFRHLPPSGVEEREEELITLVTTEAYLASLLLAHEQMPPLAEVNRVLESGSGDDGHFVMRWQPFTISEKEYAELAKALKQKRRDEGQR